MISYTPHFFERIDTEPSAFARIEHLIMKHGPRLMKQGGGGVSRVIRDVAYQHNMARTATNRWGLSDVARAAIIADYNATNATDAALAERHGVSPGCVSKTLLKAGIRRGKGCRGFLGKGRVAA